MPTSSCVSAGDQAARLAPAAAAEAQGEHAHAASLARAQLTEDALLEPAHRQLIRTHYLGSERTAAPSAGAACQVALCEGLGVAPNADTRALLATAPATDDEAAAPRISQAICRHAQRAIAQHLEPHNAEPARLAAHWEAAGDPARAAPWYHAAGRRARRPAHPHLADRALRDGLDWMQSVLRFYVPEPLRDSFLHGNAVNVELMRQARAHGVLAA